MVEKKSPRKQRKDSNADKKNGCCCPYRTVTTSIPHIHTALSPLVVEQGVVSPVGGEVLSQLLEPERERVVQRRVASVLLTHDPKKTARKDRRAPTK